LAQTALTWFSQLKLPVITVSNTLDDVTWSTATVLNDAWGGEFLAMWPNNISLVFFVLMLMKLWLDCAAVWSAAYFIRQLGQLAVTATTIGL